MDGKSCFGCGQDWVSRWEPGDLAKVKIDGEPHDVCPDCIEEVIEQYDALL